MPEERKPEMRMPSGRALISASEERRASDRAMQGSRDGDTGDMQAGDVLDALSENKITVQKRGNTHGGLGVEDGESRHSEPMGKGDGYDGSSLNLGEGDRDDGMSSNVGRYGSSFV